MNQPHDILHDLLADYLLGLLSEEEIRQMERHLDEGCAACTAELGVLRATLAVLATTAPHEPAPAHAKARLLGAIRAEASPPIRTVVRMPAWGRVTIAALAAACLLLALDGQRLREDRVGLRSDAVIARARIAELESQVDDAAQWAALVTGTNARFAQLAPTPDGDAAMAGWAVYDPQSRRAAIVFEQAQAPAGRDYELWAIEGGAPRSLGVIRADASGRAALRIEAVGGTGPVAAFAVSREPAGGSPDKAGPSGPVVLVGALGE
jgi:anti-sigma-K factor RskA